jgi:hypothetical protein
MILYILFSWAFFCLSAAFEFRRTENFRKLDTFSLITLAFAVVYVFAPSVLYWASPDDASFTKFIWMRHLPGDAWTYAICALLVLGAYVCIYLGYAISRGQPRLVLSVSAKTYLIVGSIFTIGGLIAFLAFLQIVGGPVTAFQKAWYLRQGTPDDLPFSQFAFVKRLSFFVVPGSVFLLQGASRRLSYWPIAALAVASALVILTFMNGRLQLAIYVAPILLVMLTFRNGVTPRTVLARLCVACLMLGVIAGTKTLMQTSAAFVDAPAIAAAGSPPSANEPVHRASALAYHLPQKVVSVGLEFAFPFCNLLSVLTSPPEPRWFMDLVLPIFHLIPKRIVPIADYLPARLYELNTMTQVGAVTWGIPVDLICFGYFSLGAFGVLVVSFGFGWLARRVEMMMPGGNYGDDVFRLSLMFLIASLVMYGDPNWLVIEQFHWLFAVLLYTLLTGTKSKLAMEPIRQQ